MAMAEAAFSFATGLVAIVEPIERTRRAPDQSAVAPDQRFIAGACRASMLPAVNSTISASSSCLRGIRPVNAVSTGAPIATPSA